ncbi:MAG: NAD(P)/FAD-dependent oxidoreductase [Desulfuromonadales bacterium]
MTDSYDIVALGSGTTAFAGALKAADMGARVLLIEQSQLGGTCVNWGCVPSKTLIDKAATNFAAIRGRAFGVNLTPGPPDCRRLMAAKNKAVEELRRENYQNILEGNPRIDVKRGHGRFLSPRELQVGAEVLVADRFLIACGGIPRTARIPGLSDVDYLTSYSALHLPCFPRSLIILGGGVIALEMGQMFSRFGAQVTIVERGERILKDFDQRLTDLFQKQAEEEGMVFHLGMEAKRVARDGDDILLHIETGGEEKVVRAERIMLAIGTAPATEDIGLDAAGVERDSAGFIRTDAEMATTAPGIWAAGDCTGPPLIAPAGVREAEVAVENMLFPAGGRRIDHRHTPMAVFTDPEFATVGLPLAQAQETDATIAVTFLPLEKVAKAHVIGRRHGGILLASEGASGRLLGIEILAPRAADIIHEAVLAVRFGLTVQDLASTVHVYPTLSDGLRLAALANLRQLGEKQAEISPWQPGP